MFLSAHFSFSFFTHSFSFFPLFIYSFVFPFIPFTLSLFFIHQLSFLFPYLFLFHSTNNICTRVSQRLFLVLNVFSSTFPPFVSVFVSREIFSCNCSLRSD
ncbi:hypothetical protein BZA77DRAFT_317273 [Pyronema omphalodes]|nr:hypothetical protein BZA77DRAFT_317273 [Pyronema omphalodes]